MSLPELGEIRKVFKPGLDNLIAGILIGEETGRRNVPWTIVQKHV